MVKIFQIILTNEKTGDYIVLDAFRTFEQAEIMLQWYLSHNSFFNGSFSIRDYFTGDDELGRPWDGYFDKEV